MKRIVSLLLVLLLVLLSFGPAVAASKDKGTTITLTETKGTVTVYNASGKKITLRANMPLNNGYTVQTAKASSAYIALDNTTAIQLDAATRITVKKSGKQLEVVLDAGKLVYSLDQPLPGDSSVSFRNVTMVTGVRGSDGWIERLRSGMLHGSAIVSFSDILTGRTGTTKLSSGELIKYLGGSSLSGATLEEGSAGATLEEANHEKVLLTVDQVPAIAAELVKGDDELRDAINNDGIFSGDQLIGLADEKATEEGAELEAKEAQIQQDIAALDEQIEATTTQTGTVDPVFEDDTTSEYTSPIDPNQSSSGSTIGNSFPLVKDTSDSVTFSGTGWSMTGYYSGSETEYRLQSVDLTISSGYRLSGESAKVNQESITLSSEESDGITTYFTSEISATAETGDTLTIQGTVEPIPKHTVNFYVDGSVWHTMQVEDGQPIDTSFLETKPVPTKQDANFLYWATDSNGENQYIFHNPDTSQDTPVTADLSLFAYYQPVPSYTIYFNTNGGSGQGSIDVPQGGTLTRPEDPKKDNCTFEGWYTDEGLQEPYDFSTPVTSSFTLHAKYTDNSQSGNQPIDPGNIRFPYFNTTADYNIDRSSDGWSLTASYTEDGGTYYLSNLSLTIYTGYALYSGVFEYYATESDNGVSIPQTSNSPSSESTTYNYATTDFLSGATTDSYVHVGLNVMAYGGNISGADDYAWTGTATTVLFDVGENEVIPSGLTVPSGWGMQLRTRSGATNYSASYTDFTVNGDLFVNSGIVIASGEAATASPSFVVGESGKVEFGGSFSFASGTVTNDGTFVVSGGGSNSSDGAYIGGVFTNNGTLTIDDYGTLAFEGGSIVNNGAITGSGVVYASPDTIEEYITGNGTIATDTLNFVY